MLMKNHFIFNNFCYSEVSDDVIVRGVLKRFNITHRPLLDLGTFYN